jgi:hypothetical protein
MMHQIPTNVIEVADRLSERMGVRWTRLEEEGLMPRTQSLRLAHTSAVVHINSPTDIVINGERVRTEEAAGELLTRWGL